MDVIQMRKFKITFKLEEPFGPLEKMIKEAIIEGKNYGYPEESIIETALSEYDVLIHCRGEEVFNATVHFNEFLYELFRSFLGSYDPRLIVYGFRKDGHLYFVSMDYWKVCRIPTSEFVKSAMNVAEEAILELESRTHLFEENGIRRYGEMINRYRELIKRLKCTNNPKT